MPFWQWVTALPLTAPPTTVSRTRGEPVGVTVATSTLPRTTAHRAACAFSRMHQLFRRLPRTLNHLCPVSQPPTVALEQRNALPMGIALQPHTAVRVKVSAARTAVVCGVALPKLCKFEQIPSNPNLIDS